MTQSTGRPTDAVDFHSEIAPNFHASYQSDANRLERVRLWSDLLDKYAKPGQFAYDIGCGSGVLACEMARRGINTIGIDGARGMLDIATQMAKSAGLTNIAFQQHRLPISYTKDFREADIIISSSVIEYLESITEALVFLRNLLKREGVVIFSVSNRDSLSRKLVRLIHRLTGRPKYFGLLRHFMTIEDIQRDLHASGLVYIEHAYFGRSDRINRLLSIFVAPKFSSNMLLVVAQKI